MLKMFQQQHCHNSKRSTFQWESPGKFRNQHRVQNIEGGASDLTIWIQIKFNFFSHLGTVANKLCTVVDLNRLHRLSTVYLRSDTYFNLFHFSCFHFVLVALLCYSVLKLQNNCLLTLLSSIVSIYLIYRQILSLSFYSQSKYYSTRKSQSVIYNFG